MRHARPDLGEALTALGGEGRVDPPLPHDVRGQVGERVAVPFAVVDLDEPVVDLHLHAARDTDGLGRLTGAAQRAAGDRDGWRPHREREGQRGGLLAPRSLSGGSRRPRSRPLALASVSPWRASTSVLTTLSSWATAFNRPLRQNSRRGPGR